MKRIAIPLCALFIAASAIAAESAKQPIKQPIKETKKDKKWQPLAGSEFAKKNPGILPYEECKIYAFNGPMRLASFFTIGYGELLQTDSASEEEFNLDFFTYLGCESKKLNVAYFLPIGWMGSKRIGAFGLPSGSVASKGLRVENLDGKTLRDFYGKYKGFELGLTAFIGYTYKRMKHNGIKLKYSGVEIGFPTSSNGAVSIELGPMKKLSSKWCENKFILIDDKTDTTVDQRHCPQPTEPEEQNFVIMDADPSLERLLFQKVD